MFGNEGEFCRELGPFGATEGLTITTKITTKIKLGETFWEILDNVIKDIDNMTEWILNESEILRMVVVSVFKKGLTTCGDLNKGSGKLPCLDWVIPGC